MTTYKQIFGKPVKVLSSDPTDAGAEGQVWYNTTDGVFKTVLSVGAWSSGDNINTAGYGAAGTGTQTAGLIAGRNAVTPSADVPSNATEEYNGSAWTGGGNLSNARYYGGSLGTQTSSLITGGDNRPPGTASNTFTELYNGSSWTSGTAYPIAVRLSSGLGTRAAGLMLNGSDTTYSSTTNEYNGSWTSGGSLNTARRWIGTAGTQTAGLAFGGQIPPSGYSTNVTEEYGGTSWTSGANLNVTRAVNAVGGGINQDGSQTNALAAGGYQSSGSPKTYFNETEAYDGTSWSAKANMAAARGYGTGGGSGSAGIVVGAYTGSLTSATEEFNTSVYSPIAATWSAEGNLPAPRFNGGQGIGIESAAAIFGGNVSSVSYPYTNSTNEYDGSSWTNGGNLNNTGANRGAFGTQTAGLSLGSYQYPPNVSTTNVEEYNGSAWTAKSAMGTSRYGAGGAGTSTAGLVIGGSTKPPGSAISTVEEYNGSGWTAGGTMPNAVLYLASGGTQTAAIRAGGTRSGAPRLDETFEYDGSSWTAGGTMGTARYLCNGSGGPTAQTAMLIAGGQTATATTGVSEVYNGTAWATTASLGTARNQHMNAQFNNANNALVAGGVPPSSGISSSERFTSEVVQLDYKTLTSS